MNLFAISSIITMFASIGFGLFVYVADSKSILGRRWLFLSVCIGLWALGLWGVTTASSLASALGWQTLLDLSAFFIPLAYLLFVLAFLNTNKPALIAFAVLGAVGLVALRFTSLYIRGMGQSIGLYWILPGPLYILFPIYYGLITIVSLVLLLNALRTADKATHGRILFHLLAAVVGFSGGATNFFPQFFNVYPYGNYFVILYVALMSYSVVRYQMFNVKIAAAQLFAGGLILASIFNLFDASSLSSSIIRLIVLVIVIFFSYQLVRSVYNEIAQRELIEKQRNELASINRQQESLLHFISHEVKGYLTSSQGALAGIVEGDYGEAPPHIKELAASALAHVRHGVNTVNDILNASNIKKGAITFDKAPFDLSTAVAEVVDRLQGTAQEKNLTLEYAKPVTGAYTVVGDKAKLMEHVVRNLVDNSIHYTLSGTVRVELSRNESVVRLIVSDTGIGITPEDMANLFTEGGRGKDSTKVNVHSTGYGLFIAKQVVDAHNGTIRAESEGAGKGSRFIVELPITG